MLEFGNLKMPYLDSSEAPDIGGQALAQAQRLELISGAGVALVADATGLADLVTDGDAFNGLLAFQNDTDQLWVRRASSTVPMPLNVRRQLDTTNDTVALQIQAGAGKITGATATSVNEVVTFGTAFLAGTVPIVLITFAGTKTPQGAYDPGNTTTSTLVDAAVDTISNTVFTARIKHASANLSNTNDYYYSWIALGVPA